jgi:hypothetical protein
MPRLLIILGLFLITAGLLWQFGDRFGLGKLPGDFYLKAKSNRIYIPLTTCIILSIALSFLLWILNNLKK